MLLLLTLAELNIIFLMRIMDIMVHINSLIEGITFPFQYLNISMVIIGLQIELMFCFDDYHYRKKMNDVKSQMHKMKEAKKRMDRPPSTLMCYLKMAGKRCVIGFIRIACN